MADRKSLTVENVEWAVHHCMAGPSDNCIEVEGIRNSFRFDRGRVEDVEGLIVGWLSQLPHQFHELTGGGWSFLNACDDRHGRQWASHHYEMERLFCLGMAAGWCGYYTEERALWEVMPGGMPYLIVWTNRRQPA